MVELQPSKLITWVRFPSPAPFNNNVELEIVRFFIRVSNLINREEAKQLKIFIRQKKNGNYL